RERAFANREPFGDDLSGARPVPGRTRAQHDAKNPEIGEAARARIERCGHGPDEYGNREPALRSDAVVQLAGETLTGGVGDEKPGRDAAELQARPLQLRPAAQRK